MEANLPRILVIADGFTTPNRSDLILDLAEEGVLPWVQMRDHQALERDFVRCARRLIQDIARVSPSTLVSLNGRPELAAELGVGLHLGFRSISPVDARSRYGPDMLIGYSAHADSHIAVIAQCDYITYSPVFPVQKSPSGPPLGLERLSHMVNQSTVPVFALGAITVERVADCLQAGAYGVAMFSGVMGSEDPVSAARRYIESADQHSHARAKL